MTRGSQNSLRRNAEANHPQHTSIAVMGQRVAKQLLLWMREPTAGNSTRSNAKPVLKSQAVIKSPAARRQPKPRAVVIADVQREPPTNPPPDGSSMKDRYAWVTRTMLKHYGIRVRKWRTSMSGVAWQVAYQDGSVSRLIESPRPTGPMSAAVFLHEIGHHAIGFGTYTPRCLEEYHAWRWSLEQMEANGLNVTDAVKHRMHLSLWYALDKAKRRGLKRVPEELIPFSQRPQSRRRASPQH
jgi:hypothetical protein